MGEKNIEEIVDEQDKRNFTRHLLEDVQALERMLEDDVFESGVRRIGAEQEFFLVDSAYQPSLKALEVLDALDDRRFTTELGRFNLEANLDPHLFQGSCLSEVEGELEELVTKVRTVSAPFGVRPVLIGILPTLQKKDLTLDSMTPHPRYYQLDRVMKSLRGSDFQVRISGTDELQTSHDNVMLEACNTSFQIHFQVGPQEFARLYNLAQLATAPVLAAAVNSPVLLNHRLWQETRVALFQQSVDDRSDTHSSRGGHSRVSFGTSWLDDSILEIFREDIARFRIIMSADREASPLELLSSGKLPKLESLCLHNSTVYRWNRGCYGVNDGIAHLRIENRVLPAGPTVLDEVSNAAFFFGLLSGLAEDVEDIRTEMAFDDARTNFRSAARYGLGARIAWRGERPTPADELIRSELLPIARRGLEVQNIREADIDRYLGVIAERVTSGRTGAQWFLDSLNALQGDIPKHEKSRRLTEALHDTQQSGIPVHEWPIVEAVNGSMPGGYRHVGQIMTTDVFTVGREDLVDLAAKMMDWRHIRHVPVEGNDGELLGLVTIRRLLREVFRQGWDASAVAVEKVMKPDPVVATPEMTVRQAIELMREHKVGCLPVVENETNRKLVGIVTQHDFFGVASDLLDRWLAEDDEGA